MALSQAFIDELEVLQSIYHTIKITKRGEHTLISYDLGDNYMIKFCISEGYPESCSPTVQTDFLNSSISKNDRLEIVKQINVLIKNSMGVVVIFQAIELLREAVQHNIDQNSTQASIQDPIDLKDHNWEPATYPNEIITSITNTRYKDQTITTIDSNMNIIHGDITYERKSSFQSHLCKVKSMDEVNKFHHTIINDKKYSNATHNIFIYRFVCDVSGTLYHDYDDDGETAAGGRIAEMIRLIKINNIAIIVSRWFGGILLGPERFKFLCNSARTLLETNGYVSMKTSKLNLKN